MAIVISNPNPGDIPPPSGHSVLAVWRAQNGGQSRIRALYIRRGTFEAPDENEWVADAESFFDWIDEEPYWPEGWYEATASDPYLFPLPEGSVIAWVEFPILSFGEGE